jgi:hypothetical protein
MLDLAGDMCMKSFILNFFLLTGLAAAWCGCDRSGAGPTLAGSWEYREVKRIKSPEALVEAVLLTGDAGATTASTTCLYLVPPGTRIDPVKEGENKACFVADHLSNLAVVWKGPRLIEIFYDEGRIHHFQNRWHHREVQDFRYVVELRLAPSTNEFALPAGDRIW